MDAGRLAEVPIALSLATDLGTGQPMEHGLRTCLLASRAANDLGLDTDTRRCVYYVALLRFVGCTSDASQTALLAGGDDLAFNAMLAPMLFAEPRGMMRHLLRHLAQGLPPPRRAGRVARLLADPGGGARSLAQHCEAGERLAGRLGLPNPVRNALAHAYERWDGRGPSGLAGDDVPIAVRVVTVARDAELWARGAGWATAMDVLGHRRGRAFDPAVVDAFLYSGEGWLASIGDDAGAEVLDGEPGRALRLAPGGLDRALQAIADFADLKSPYLRGHSTSVAMLARGAAEAAGLSEADARTVGRAALVHDVGRVGVPSGIWDHPGPLTAQHWERVRLHPYLTERVLARCTPLSDLRDLACAHHERVDGSGYHRGTSGVGLGLAARVLAAADTYHAMTEDRPYRPARSPQDAATRLLAEVESGRFRRPEVDAVLAASGQLRRTDRSAPAAGLTEREVDVLRLIARGLSNKQVAARLHISPKTVGTHLEHVYAKAGVHTRAGVTLFAMEQRLLGR